MPVSLSSSTSRVRPMGSRIWSSKGPTVRSVGSSGMRREPWNACCSPPRTMEKAQSRIPRFGYRHRAMPK